MSYAGSSSPYSGSPCNNTDTAFTLAPDSFYYRHPLHGAYSAQQEHPNYPFVSSLAWSEDSPNSSGRSVSPCDEYQPPVLISSYNLGSGIGGPLQDLQQQPTCTSTTALNRPVQPYARVTKRRTTANKKERRRTQSINNAFADLRDCIPNVPSDTKLSKIKTLRLATSYIAYLMGVLADEDMGGGGFRAEMLGNTKRGSHQTRAAHHHQSQQCIHQGQGGGGGGYHTSGQQVMQIHHHEDQVTAAEHARRCQELAAAVAAERKIKGRTGWPQHVWALELKP